MSPLQSRPQPVPVTAFEFAATGPYTGVADHRDLLRVSHPWQDSEAGNRGEWRARVTVPGALRAAPRLYLSFYQSDNYSGDAPEDADWVGVHQFVGHRYKQVLFNGEVVWEQDVATAEMLDDPPSLPADPVPPAYADGYGVVALEPPPDGELELVLRVVDQVASREALPGDRYYRYSWGEADPVVTRHWFQTDVFFGDVCLSDSPAPYRPARPIPAQPVDLAAAPSVPTEGIALPLWTPAELPTGGYPARCGVPLPRGLVAADTSLALSAPDGSPHPAVITPTSHWSDGSVRWVLCEFVVTQAGTWRLRPGAEPAACLSPVTVQDGPEGLVLRSGELTVHLGPAGTPGLFRSVTVNGQERLGAGTLSMKLNRVGWLQAFAGERTRVEIESADDVRVVVRLAGEMRAEDGDRLGPWTARLQVWSGLSDVYLEWGVVNESDQAMALLLDWSARFALPAMPEATADFGEFLPVTMEQHRADWWFRASSAPVTVPDLRALRLTENTTFLCRQDEAGLARIKSLQFWVGAAVQAPGYVRVSEPERALLGAMRWFAEEFPKGIRIQPGEVQLATLPELPSSESWAHDLPSVRLGRGESKRQVMALRLGGPDLDAAEAERFTACLNDPPRLYDRAWFLDSRALETGPGADLPELAAWEAAVEPILAWSGVDALRLGHREYWDTAWMNNYRSRAHAGLLRYVATGDPRWHRYMDAVCRHFRDVDVIHFCPEHPEWVGSAHIYSVDHTSGPAGMHISLSSDDLLEHYLLTGDRDSLAAAQGLAAQLLACEPLSRSARAVGWPLAQLTRWYDQTGDERFRARAEEFLRAALLYTEPRRGIFDEKHGNYNYHGSVPFMTAYLGYGAVRYHELTGDPRALELLARLAAGVLTETQTQPGFFRYSPNPEGNLTGRAASTCGWSVNLGGMCAYLYLQTGDPVYRQGLLDCYAAVLAHPDEISLDMVELQGWLLRGVGAVATEGAG